MNAKEKRRRVSRRPKNRDSKVVPLTKKDMKGKVMETLLRDHEGLEKIEGQLDMILHAWAQSGVTPLTMVYLATQLQETSMVIYHDSFTEHVTGMLGKLSKKDQEKLEKNFERMCKVIRRRSLNALVSRLEESDNDGGKSTDGGSSQRNARSNDEMTYVPSKERPGYIY